MSDIPALTALGNQCAANGEYKAAAGHFLAVYRATGEYAPLYAYAMAGQAYDRPAVIAECRAYLARLDIAIHDRCNLLATILNYVESEERIARCLDYFTADTLDEPPFQYARDELRQYIDAAWRWVDEQPDHPHAIGKAAYAAHAEGQYGLCDTLLTRLRAMGYDQRLTATRFSPLEPPAGDMPGLMVLRRMETPVTRRVFTGCDVPYWRQHGEGLARSVAMNSSGAGFHLHLFNPPPNFPYGFVTKTLVELFGDAYAVTAEYCPPRTDKHYFASMRLPRLYQITADGVPTVHLDTDLFVNAPLDPVFALLDNADVALCRIPGRLTLHSQINASVVAVGPGGRDYLARVAGYVLRCWAEDVTPWCLDQTALHCVLRQMQGAQQTPGVRFAPIGPGIYNGGMGPHTVLWAQKCAPDSEWVGTADKARKRYGKGA